MAVINLTKERSKTAIKRPYKTLCASLRNFDFKSDQCFCSNAHAILQQPIAFCRWANIELNPVKHGSKDAIRFPHGASPSRLNRSTRITGSSVSSLTQSDLLLIFYFILRRKRIATLNSPAHYFAGFLRSSSSP